MSIGYLRLILEDADEVGEESEVTFVEAAVLVLVLVLVTLLPLLIAIMSLLPLAELVDAVLTVLRLVALDVALVEPDARGILTSLKLRDAADVPWAETLSSLRTCMSSLLLLMLVAGAADTTAVDAVDTAGEESLLFFPVLTDSRGTTRI